jgi:type II secretory pathway predicted ATPase ExeA
MSWCWGSQAQLNLLIVVFKLCYDRTGHGSVYPKKPFMDRHSLKKSIILSDSVKMYLKHFNLTQSPFAEEPDPNIFFPDAERVGILNSLKKDLQSGTPLTRLTGNEGSGKTMLCRLLLRDLPAANFEVIYLDNPVGSFQDLLYIVCCDLGMEPTADPATDLLPELHNLLEESREKQKKIILLVDEAEKLFLAALERLLRAICEVNDTPVLQVVLAGRPELDEHLKQLEAYCTDIDIESKYQLEPLTEEEVAAYLKFRLTAVGLPADTEKEVFSSGAVHKIFESARGNLHLVNMLAEEALQASSADKSFLVLLDHVVEQDSPGTGGGLAIPPPGSKKKIWLAGGACVALLLAFFLFGRGGDQEPITDNGLQSSQPLVQQATGDEPEIIEQLPDDPSEIVLTEPDEPPTPPLAELEVEVIKPGKPTEQQPDETGSDKTIADTPPADNQQQTTLPNATTEQTAPLQTMSEPVPETSATAVETVQDEPEASPVDIEPEDLSAAEIVELHPDRLKTVPKETVDKSSDRPLEVTDAAKTRPEDYPEPPQETSDLVDELNTASELDAPAKTEDDTTVEEIAEPDQPGVNPPTPSNLEKEQLYQQLLSLGERWRTGIHQDQYTVQMIALTSRDAIPNLKSMLFREEYQAIRDQLYILRKPTAPPTIYVFFGIYDSMDQARNARNNMPLFLRKHHPYALSIAKALKKTEY